MKKKEIRERKGDSEEQSEKGIKKETGKGREQ